MIAWVRIRGLGVIDDVEVEFGPGFNVITGESGAGKTMILRAIYLLLGAKADPGLIREGHERIEVEGAFRLDEATRERIRPRLSDAGIDLDDEDLLVSRTVARDSGRSRASVHGRSVPAAVLVDIGHELVAVHGQGDQVRLLQGGRQRAALDRYAGAAVLDPLDDYRAGHARWMAIERELADLVGSARERVREADLLAFGVQEIDAVDPAPGEDDVLAAEAARLAHAEQLRELSAAARGALSADGDADGSDALTLVGAAQAALARIAAIDAGAEGLAAALREARLLLDDVAGEIASYAAGIDADPIRLAVVEERRAALAGLKRKYAESIDGVIAWREDARARLVRLNGDDSAVGELTAERDRVVERLRALAAEVSTARTDAAARLSDAVTGELVTLAMPKARVVVQVRPGDDLGAHGVDEVDVQLASHADAPLRSLAKAASGGELSRVMLAIEVSLLGEDDVASMLFDEVDAGVGGDAARALGTRLARVASRVQVIAVTHLAQVAALAGHHVALLSDAREADGISVLGDDARVAEIARMLAGEASSAAAVAHARELLARS